MRFEVEFKQPNKKFNTEFGNVQYYSEGGYDLGYKEGHDVGLTEGEAIGYSKGEMVGYENGYTEGDAKGYERGYGEGETEGYTNGYSKGVEDTTPSGEIELTQNGTHDVAKFATAKVNVGGFTMQDFVDGRQSLDYLYYYTYISKAPSKNALKWLEEVDLSRITSAKSLFEYCTSLTDEDVPIFDTSNLKEMTQMFCKCFKLTKVPNLDYSKATWVTGIFKECTSIETAGDIDFSASIDNQTVFYQCTKLTSVGEVKTNISASSVAFNNMFSYSPSLVSVGPIDVRNASYLNCFNNCKALTNLIVKNIKINFQVGSGTSWGHLLTVDSLVGLCYELRDTGSSKTLTVGSANLEKLANVYVRAVEITDDMRAADDLIDEKLPFEVCESTDEGATLIADYILAKNWGLK